MNIGYIRSCARLSLLAWASSKTRSGPHRVSVRIRVSCGLQLATSRPWAGLDFKHNPINANINRGS